MDYQVLYATTHHRPIQVLHPGDALTTIKVDPVGIISLEHYEAGQDAVRCELTADEADEIGKDFCLFAAFAELRKPIKRKILAGSTAESRISIDNGKIEFLHAYTAGDLQDVPSAIPNQPDLFSARFMPTGAIHVGQQLVGAAAYLHYLNTLMEQDAFL